MRGGRFAKRISHAAWMARDFVTLVRGANRERFGGIIDFSYQHYALGDVLTSQVNMACLAADRGCLGVDLYVIVNPWAPSALAQGFITPENYQTYLDNLFPALLCLPGLRSFRLMRDRLTAGLAVLALFASRVPTWPSMRDHLGRRMTYPMTHRTINRFHARHGYVPHLAAPRGYAGWAQEFVRRFFPGRFLVCVNARQSRLTSVPATTYRDAPLQDWYEFFRIVETKYPDVQFLMLGGYPEWEHTLLGFRNVTIPRTVGLTLAHELALIHASHLFIGTSSGFATMATFGRVPYVITSVEHFFSPYAEVPIDAERYPFAVEHQYLIWRREDTRLLLDYFERIYHAVPRPRRAWPVRVSLEAAPALEDPAAATKGASAGSPSGRPRMTFYIDVFSSCNLACPSCPVSNLRTDPDQAPKGLMSRDLLGRILTKATREAEVTSVALFNWTEPLLHPQLADLVRVVKDSALFCSLSSNLNVLRHADDVLAAGVDWFRVSVSGFHQAVYERTHRGGDIEKVKANMRELAAAKQRTGSRVDIEVFFHRYLGNFADELEMRRFAESLGFRFTAAWAQMMPVEKVLSYLDPARPLVSLSADDYELIERLALPLDEAVSLTAQHPVSSCPLQDDYMTLDVQGNAYLCCATSARSSNRLGSFLTTSTEELQRRKRAHPLCGPCMGKGLPLYLEHRLPQFQELGLRLRPAGAEARTP